MVKRNNKKKSYKGPFHKNSEVSIHNVKKVMRPNDVEPTIDGFTNVDYTDTLASSKTETTSKKRKPRPTKEKKYKLITKENIIIFLISLVASGIGVVVYNYSNRFVAVEKDVQYIQTDINDLKSKTDKTSDKTDEVDKKVEVLLNKIDDKRLK